MRTGREVTGGGLSALFFNRFQFGYGFEILGPAGSPLDPYQLWQTEAAAKRIEHAEFNAIW